MTFVPDGPPGVVWERAACVLCGGTHSRQMVVAADPLYDRSGRMRIVCCSGCGHWYQDPRPTRETIGLCYSHSYGPHLAAADSGPSASGGRAEHPWYLSAGVRSVPGLRRLYYWLSDKHSDLVPAPPSPDARVLEIGSGSGNYLARLQQLGWDAEGIEPAAEPAERCRQRGLRVRTGTFESCDFGDAVFDLIVAWMVVEHLHDPGAALRRVRQLLKQEGAFLFSVPNIACWETTVFGRYHYNLNEPTHLHHFSPRTLRRLLSQSGFRVHRLLHQQNLYNVVPSVGIWLRRRFPRRGWGDRLVAFADHPSLWGRLALAPAAKLLAALRQGGRLTVVARPQPDHPAAGRTSLRSPRGL